MSCYVSILNTNRLQIFMDKNLRAQPFFDGVLREMAINFPAGQLKELLSFGNY